MAPVCTSFSRARDRTKVIRNHRYPWGIPRRFYLNMRSTVFASATLCFAHALRLLIAAYNTIFLGYWRTLSAVVVGTFPGFDSYKVAISFKLYMLIFVNLTQLGRNPPCFFALGLGTNIDLRAGAKVRRAFAVEPRRGTFC